MKVTVPLESTLCTDSHNHDIKNPAAGRDLFSKNHTYLFNRQLTNPRKSVIPPGNYITTMGDLLEVVPGSVTTRIVRDGNLIANVLSLGIEEELFITKDDAVIDSGSLWTVQKTLEGYTLEQTDLQTKEVTTTQIIQAGIVDVCFVKNTHKVITRNQDGGIAIDGTVYENDQMKSYLSVMQGEFIAVEVNDKIYFGYQNPTGIIPEEPQEELNLSITGDINGWALVDNIPDQLKAYRITIDIADGVIVGGGSNGIALDLYTGVVNPLKHHITINVGANVVVSGAGGNGGSSFSIGNVTNGGNGSAAIQCGSNLVINGNGKIQGGGGGGNASNARLNTGIGGIFSYGGGGGAGRPAGLGGSASGGVPINTPGQTGTLSTGGSGGAALNKGGDPGQDGGAVNFSSENTTYSESTPGNGGNALIMIGAAAYTIDPAITILGGITII